jgi:hypothetical protein
VSEIRGLEDDIARTRADLADTVDQLAAKAEQVKKKSVSTAAVVGGAVAVGLVVLLVVRKVRSR